jgi:putative ABC transport system permease protein
LQEFVIGEFTQFGTNIININPGKTTTQGVSVGVFGTVRPLSLEDTEALSHLPNVVVTNPGVAGNAEVGTGGRTRRVMVLGEGPDFTRAFKMRVALGQWLPKEDARQARAFVVLGSKVKQELFGETTPLGARIEIGGSRFRVIGVMESKGQVLGFDMDDAVYIPAARALELFNREGLMEVHVVHEPDADVDRVVEGIRRMLIARHGREDFSITPQQKMLDVLNSVLQVLTFAVGALGGISLAVGGVGILTIMTIAVAERTAEIGLLRALGARRRQVLLLFLAEATLLAAVGGLSGLLLGYALAQLLHAVFPALPVSTPWLYALLAELIAMAVGLAAGVAPASRAARLDPVEALRAE